MTVTTLHRKLGERFTDNSGNALIGGKLYYYAAGTTTLQNTYSDSAGAAANTNPIILDSAGRIGVAVYLGPTADYKELLTDSTGATISPWPMDNIPKAVDPLAGQTGFSLPLIPWIVVTAAQSPFTITTAHSGYGFAADTSGGSIVFNVASAASIGSGKLIWFKKTASANTVSITPNGTDTIDGANAAYTLSAANQGIGIDSDGAGWQIISSITFLPAKPQGRLTLTTGTPVLAADVTNTGTVYYTAYEGNTVPVWNGAAFVPVSFSSDLSLTLTASAGANSIVDVFCINQSGVLVLGFGPSWSNVTAGSCARGTGAGTTEIENLNGLWVNANIIALTNGATTYASIAANQATYLGSLFIDGTAGKVSCHVAYGQSRKWGVWNAYNRKPILMQAGDSTASWTISGTWAPSNEAAANTAAAFTGLPEEPVTALFSQTVGVNNRDLYLGIGWNSTSSPSGMVTQFKPTSGMVGQANQTVRYRAATALGINNVTCLEAMGADTGTAWGTSTYMLLEVSYMG